MSDKFSEIGTRQYLLCTIRKCLEVDAESLPGRFVFAFRRAPGTAPKVAQRVAIKRDKIRGPEAGREPKTAATGLREAHQVLQLVQAIDAPAP